MLKRQREGRQHTIKVCFCEEGRSGRQIAALVKLYLSAASVDEAAQIKHLEQVFGPDTERFVRVTDRLTGEQVEP